MFFGTNRYSSRLATLWDVLRRAVPSRWTVSVTVVCLCVNLGLASYGGVFRSELSSQMDEPAHYITALMVHDYLSDGLFQSPLEFAKQFYLHYPKVAFGHWPPMFYIIQGAFMFIFGTSRTAILTLMLLMSALLAATLYRVVQQQFHSHAAGLISALYFLLIPLVQSYSGAVMADLPVAVFSFWAMLAWARYLESQTTASAVCFGCFSAAAILTKGNAYALVFIPVVSIVLSSRWAVLKSRVMWLTAAGIAVVCVPWSWFTSNLVVPTMVYSVSWSYLLQGGWFYARTLALVPGLLTTGFAVAGIYDRVIRRGFRVTPLWASAMAALIGVELFHSLVPAGLEDRYLLASLPPLIMFAVAGVAWCASRIPLAIGLRYRVVGLAAAAIGFFFVTTFHVEHKFAFGFAPLVKDLLTNAEYRNAIILCSSDDRGEGLLISEMAMREQRPGHIILRASRMLADSDWIGRGYSLKMDTPEKIRQWLESVPVGIVVLDRMVNKHTGFAHHALLRQAVSQPPWRLASVYPGPGDRGTAPGARVEVYVAEGLLHPASPRFRVALKPMPQITIDGAAQ
jgi:hypothetical protein